MKAILFGVAFLILCNGVQAVEPTKWISIGIGNDSCASFVLALKDDRPSAAVVMGDKTYYTMANAYTQWINGFVTAVNLKGRPESGQINVDVNGIALWVKNYCEKNPSKLIIDGAGEFVLAHQPRN